MLEGFSALFYLEYRQIVNRVRSIGRNPGRAAAYAIALSYFVAVSVLRARHQHSFPPSISEPYASAIFFAYVVLLGVLAYGAASGILGAFSSSADARFLIGSRIPERAVVVWLQIRRSATTLTRMIFTILLYTLVFAQSGTLAGIGLAMIGGAIAAAALSVPMLKLRTVVGTRTAQSLAGAIAAIGLLPMSIVLSSLVTTRVVPAARGVERLGAGAAFNALFNGNPIALAALFGFAAVLIALSFATGTGLFADLYGASLKALNYRERVKRGGGSAFAIEHAYRQRGANAPLFDSLRGPWTIAWKEWIGFARAPSMQRLFLLGVITCAIAGAIFGSVAAGSHNPLLETLTFASVCANLIVIFIAMGSAIGLAGDLRKPLWWIGPDPLWMRLLAWMAGTSWRLALCLSIGIIAWSAAMRLPAIALAGIPIAIATVLYLRAIGLALYALFPASIDQRGPAAMLRALLTYLLAAPPGVTAVLGIALSRSAAMGIALGIAVSLAETALLLAFAAARISGRGVAFAQAEAL